MDIRSLRKSAQEYEQLAMELNCLADKREDHGGYNTRELKNAAEELYDVAEKLRGLHAVLNSMIHPVECGCTDCIIGMSLK